MKRHTIFLTAVLLLAALATPSSARTYWDQLNETAPQHPVFETLNESAP